MIGPVNNQFIIDKKTDCIIAEVGKDIIDKAIKDAAESETEVDKEAVQTDITEQAKAIAQCWQTVYKSMVPTVPTEPKATAVEGKNTIKLEWTASTSKSFAPSLLYYVVEISRDDEFVMNRKTLQGQTTMELAQLADGNYSFVIFALDPDGYQSTKTSAVTATVPGVADEGDDDEEEETPTPVLAEDSKTLTVGGADGNIKVVLTNGTFTEQATNTANWTVDVGETTCVLDTITKDDDTHCTLNFTATAVVAGTISITAKAAAITDAVADLAPVQVVLA